MRGMFQPNPGRIWGALARSVENVCRTIHQPCRSERLEPRLLLAFAPIDAEFLVNTTTAAIQNQPAIASDADSDFVIVWHGNGPGDADGVFAQRYAASGAALGAEFRVNTYTLHQQSFPSVAMDADGDFVVAWMSNLQDGYGYGIYAQRYTAAGGALGDEFSVNFDPDTSESFPSVAMDADGDFIVAWIKLGQLGSDYGVSAQRYSAEGRRQGGEISVNTFTANLQGYPSVAMDAAGDFVVVWQSDGQDGSLSGIYAQRYNAAGTAAGIEFRVNTVTINSQVSPSVVMDANGDFVVVWQSLGQDGSLEGIYAKRYTATGAAAGGEFRVNTFTANRQRSPSTAMDADGDFVIAWQSYTQDGSFEGIYAQLYSAAGATIGTEFRVNTTTLSNQASPSVAIDADGDVVAAWQSEGQDGSAYGIYAQRYDESTDTAGPIASDARISGQRPLPGEPLRPFVPELVVSFSEDLSIAGGITGPNSVTNPANWGLTRNGIDFSAQIASVTFAFNALTRKYEATVTFEPPLAGDMVYILTARQSLQDLAGNALDGNFDGAPGGNYTQTFRVHLAIGPEFHVNTYTDDSQQYPSVAADAGGNFIVAWESYGQDGFSYGIYAQRYNAAGAPVGGEFLVNTHTSNDQLRPSVAMNASGEFVIAWESESQDGSDFGIYAQRYSAAGAPVGDEFLVNTFTTDKQDNPSVAIDADGDFVAVWQSDGQDGSLSGIYAQRYDAAGAPIGDEFRVNTVTTNNQYISSVAMDAGGDFVVAWTSIGQDGSYGGIYAQRYNAAGSTVGVEFRVNTTVVEHQFRPDVAMDADGDFVVAWTSYGQDGSYDDIYAQRYNAAGSAVGVEFRVNTYTFDTQIRPAVAMDPDGDFVIVWQGYGLGDNYGIFARRYNAAGAAVGDEFRVNTFTFFGQDEPAVAIDATGDFVVAWESLLQGEPDFGIFAQRYKANEPPTTLGIDAVNVPPDSPDTLIPLFPRFADSTDPDFALIFSITANTNPALFSSTTINPATGILTLDYASGQSGIGNLTVRATDTGGLFVETSFIVNVTGSTPPIITAADFVYQTAPQRLTFTFDQDVFASLSAADLLVQFLGPGGGIVTTLEPTWDAPSKTATFALTAILFDGDYRARLLASGVSNGSTNMAGDYLLNFFFLNGDLNHDRAVTISDFIDLAANFNVPVTLWSKGDLNYDGIVTISDFIDLAANFNKSLGPPPPSTPQAAASQSSVLAAKPNAPLFHRLALRRHPHHRKSRHYPLRRSD